MISKRIFLLVAMLAFISTFVYSQTLTNYIPKDAAMVFSFNPENLNKKVNLLELQQYEFYDMMLGQMSGEMGGGEDADIMMNLLSSPSQYGLNLMGNSHFFMRQTEEGKFFGFIFQLSEETAFTDFLKNTFSEEYADIHSMEGNLHLMQESSTMAIAWKDNVAIVGGTELEMEVDYSDDEAYETAQALKATATKNWLTNVMTPTAGNSIQTNSKYLQAATKPNDAHFWINYDVFMDNMGSELYNLGGMTAGNPFADPATIMGFLKGLYKDTYLSMALNFDAGKIALDYDLIGNGTALNIYKEAMDAKFNKKMLRYIRGEELMGYWGITMNTKKTAEAYKSLTYSMLRDIPGMGEIGTSALDILGIFIDEEAIYDLFKGDMLFAVTGMQSVERTITKYDYDDDFNAIEKKETVTQNIPELSLLMSYGNEDNMMKFIRLGEKAGVLERMGNSFKLAVPELEMDAYIALKNGILFITNSVELVERKLDSGYSKKERISKKHCKMLSKNGQVLYWDIPNTLSVLGESGEMMGVGEFVNMGKQNFESITMMTSKEAINTIHTDFDINFSKKDENSLKQIFNLINELFMSMMGGGSKT